MFFKNNILENIMKMRKTKIKEIKHQEKIKNNIIIANDTSQNFSEKLFKGINEINKELDIRILLIYISQEKIENLTKFNNRTITNIYEDKINDKEFMIEKIKIYFKYERLFF